MTCNHPCLRCDTIDGELERMRETVREVADKFGIPIERILDGTDRERIVTDARHVAVWMLSERFPKGTYSRFARVTGYRERSGPSHAIRYAEQQMLADPDLYQRIAELREAA